MTITTATTASNGTKRRTSSAKVYGLKAANAVTGEFEAVVSVFGNVDFANERVQAGAFAASLDRWAASGDPIPVIFSHRWDDLDAHVGTVVEARELAPGAAELAGTPIEANGGLYIKAKLDVDDPGAPFAKRLATLLSERRIKEFSFAFDVIRARAASDGVIDLLELDLFEVGPTLLGMNPATELLAAKSFRETLANELDYGDPVVVDVKAAILEAELAALITDERELAELDADLDAEAELAAGSGFVAGPDGPELTPELAEAVNAELDAHAKALIADFPGSIEHELARVTNAVIPWALDRYGDELYDVELAATYPAEGRTIVRCERWDDPVGGGPVWELHYAAGEDGELVIGAAAEVDVVSTVNPKHRRHAIATRAAGAGAIVRDAKPNQGKADEPTEAKADDLPATSAMSPLRALTDVIRIALD